MLVDVERYLLQPGLRPLRCIRSLPDEPTAGAAGEWLQINDTACKEAGISPGGDHRLWHLEGLEECAESCSADACAPVPAGDELATRFGTSRDERAGTRDAPDLLLVDVERVDHDAFDECARCFVVPADN